MLSDLVLFAGRLLLLMDTVSRLPTR